MKSSPYAVAIKKRREPYKDLLNSVRYFLAAIVVLACCFLLFSQVYTGVRVRQSSMEPTLMNGDYIFVNRTTEAEHGDIIVVWNPAGNEYVVKRLIGLPGDTIFSENGTLYRIVAGGKEAHIVDEPYLVEDWAESIASIVVPEGEIYVMGDHRSVSKDSRNEAFGTLDQDNILGVVTDWSIRHKDFLTAIFGIFG